MDQLRAVEGILQTITKNDEYFSLETVLDALPHPVVLKAPDTEVLFVNSAYERLYGVNRKSIIGKKIAELEYLSDSEKKFFQDRDAHVMRTGKWTTRTLALAQKTHHHMLYWTGCIKQRDGRQGLVGIIVDITKQKRIAARLKDRFKQMQAKNMLLEDSTNKDFLTGLYNRKFLNRSMEALIKMSAAGGGCFSCLMVDVDHFKLVNDTYGHDVGDAVLKEVSDVLRAGCRERDIIGRFGGDEFMVLLPDTPAEHARSLAARLCADMKNRMPSPCGRNITISIGVSEYTAGDRAAGMVKRADSAMYTAKVNGRDCVYAKQTIQ